MSRLKESLPPTLISAARFVKTRLALDGWTESASAASRRAALMAMARQTLPPASGSPVLVFSFRGWYPHVAWDDVLAHALRLRGVPVHVLHCGGELPLCEVNFRGASPHVACAECSAFPADLESVLHLDGSWLRAYVEPAEARAIDDAVAALDQDALPSFSWGGAPVGACVRDSTLWYLRKATLELDEDWRAYRKFLRAGAQIAVAAPRILAAVGPRAVVEVNGKFFAERVFNHFVPSSIPITTYECGWRRDTLGFNRLSEDGPIDLDETWERWGTTALTDGENATLDEWVRTRAAGDMQRDFFIKFDQNRDPLTALGLDPRKPTAVLFSNLVWDTAVLGKLSPFRSIRHWLTETVMAFDRRPEWQLVVRVHPAEDLRPSQPSVERVMDAALAIVPLPANVRVVGSTEVISSYALMATSRATLVFTSTTGLEASVRGMPVLTGARTYYTDRGFTVDVDSVANYPRLLERVMTVPQSAGELELARRFAYGLLFRYLKRIPVVRQQPGGLPVLVPEEVDDLLPGRSAAFDQLIAGLATGGPFV